MQKKPEPVTMGADATVYIWFICQVIYRYIFSIRGTLGFYAEIHITVFVGQCGLAYGGPWVLTTRSCCIS